MRILVAVEGTRGDVYPQLALADALTAAGHEVRLCAPPDFEPEARARGLDYVAVGGGVAALLRERAASLQSRGPVFFREMVRYARSSIDAQFRTIPEVAADVDGVVAAGTVVAASSAAELHRIPYRYVAYTPALMPSAHHTPALLPVQLRSAWTNRLLWSLVEGGVDGLARLPVNAHRRRLGLAPVAQVMRHVLADRPLVAVDRPLAVVPADCPIAHEQVRCLHPLEGEPLPPDVEAFLDAGPPPVYVGFGSMPDPDPRHTTRQVLTAVERLGCRALISHGWAGLGARDLPQGVRTIGAVAHPRLFPRLAAVVHHGGAGTTHTAARSGVPQIVVPHVLDQFYFARRVHDLGVGPEPLPKTRLTAERLAAALERVSREASFSERARRLAEELAGLGPTEIDTVAVLAGATIPTADPSAATAPTGARRPTRAYRGSPGATPQRERGGAVAGRSGR